MAGAGPVRALERVGAAEIARALAEAAPDVAPSLSARRRAAVAAILRESPESGIEALFIKRAEHPLDPWSGHMAFPGGREDPEDPSLEAAARRETLEEIGLALDPAMLVGRLSDVAGGRLGSLSVSPFVYLHPGPHDLSPNEEVADVVWVPLSFLGDPSNVRPYFYPHDPAGRPFPSLPFRGYTIWGITYRMIVGFVELFGVRLPLEGDAPTDAE